jgi:hypothetical protein
MEHRIAFEKEARCKRHARGEVYSAARVAAINAMGPSKAELDECVEMSYKSQNDSEGVLKAHARSHFGYGLVSARFLLASYPADIAAASHEILRQEEAFAEAWINSIGDKSFKAELRGLQLEAVRTLRTRSVPMYMVTHPTNVEMDDLDARELGEVWRRLDDMANELGAVPLSTFIALPGEDKSAGTAVEQVVPTLTALIDRIQTPGLKFPSKRAVVEVLTRIRTTLVQINDCDARVQFEPDI